LLSWIYTLAGEALRAKERFCGIWPDTFNGQCTERSCLFAAVPAPALLLAADLPSGTFLFLLDAFRNFVINRLNFQGKVIIVRMLGVFLEK
jgi:hypothetical protein